MEEILWQSFQEILAGRQKLQMLKPRKSVRQMLEEIVIKSYFSQKNQITQLIRQLLQPIVSQINMCQIRLVLKMIRQKRLQILQPQTELIPNQNIEFT